MTELEILSFKVKELERDLADAVKDNEALKVQRNMIYDELQDLKTWCANPDFHLEKAPSKIMEIKQQEALSGIVLDFGEVTH